MVVRRLRQMVLGTALVLAGSIAGRAQTGLVITEVNASGSSAAYAADWFELTNVGPAAVSLTGWKIDDGSQSPLAAVALRGVGSIAAGQSVIFLEGLSSGSSASDASIEAAFKSAWFGSSVPANLVLGFYGGASVGLSTNGDQVNLYSPSSPTPNAPVTSVYFGTATLGRTFDNSALINSYVEPFASLSSLSSSGSNGAFLSAGTTEIGSPGYAPIPEPSLSGAVAGVIALGVTACARRRIRSLRVT